MQHLEGKVATPALLLHERKPESEQRIDDAHLIDIAHANGLQANIGNQLLNDLPAFAVRPAVEKISLHASNHRLGVERIDLYQIHLPPPRLNPMMDALAEAIRSGKVGAVGVSNFSVSLMRRAHDRLARYGVALASNQVQYSLLHRNPEKNGLLAACRELDVALIAASPLAQGMLSGKYRTGTIPRSLTRRLMGSLALGFGATRREKLEPFFAVLEEIARVHDKTIAQIALNWLIVKDACVIPIPGVLRARQASENAGALGWRLTEAEHARISQAASW